MTTPTQIFTTATFTAGQEVEYNPVLSIEGWGQVVNPFNPPRVQFSRTLGNKAYELTDHLGNVAVTITDRKIAARPVNILNPVPAYFAEVKSTQDYYPFGQLIDSRSASAYKYRFGFNGQEKDREVNNSDNLNTALYWEYDTRIGFRWNRDPKPTLGVSDYACFGDNPILYSDILGNLPGKPDDPAKPVKRKGKFEIKAKVKVTSGSVGGDVKVAGSKVGFEAKLNKQEIFAAEGGWYSKDGLNGKLDPDENKTESGLSAGKVFGADFTVEKDLNGNETGSKTTFYLGILSIENNNQIANKKGDIINTTTVKLSISGSLNLIIGGEVGAEASYTTAPKLIKNFTIDEMIQAGQTIPTQAIEYNNRMKELSKTLKKLPR